MQQRQTQTTYKEFRKRSIMKHWLKGFVAASILVGIVHASPYLVETDAATSSYAASMMYDGTTDRLYLTGSTYGGRASFFSMQDEIDHDEATESADTTNNVLSDCFLGILQLPRQNRSHKWVQRVAIGVPDQSESCSDVYTFRLGNDLKLFLSGHVIGGTSVLEIQQEMFSSSSNHTSNSTVSGMIFDMTWYAEVQGGYLLDDNVVQYPVAVVANSNQAAEEEVYVVSLQSITDQVNPAFTLYQKYETDVDEEALDLTTAGGYLPPAYGDQYSLLLQRLGRRPPSTSEIFTVAGGEDAVSFSTAADSSDKIIALKAAAGVLETNPNAESYDQYEYITEPLQQQWRKEFVAEATSVQVSSILHSKSNSSNVVIFAGSTRGSGHGLGETTDYSMSGFITIVDTTLGMVLRNRRISSGSTSDHILGLCQDDANNLYAVGMSNGKLHSQQSNDVAHESTFVAFIQKMNAGTLTATWTRTLVAIIDSKNPGSVHGMSCAVTPDRRKVYLAGTVKAGASISLDGKTTVTSSAGHDDLFVAQYRTSDGDLQFVKQLGTDTNDQLAAGQGVVCDKYGDAILLGNTRGSFLKPLTKKSHSINDVVVISIDRLTGNHVDLATREIEPTQSTSSKPKEESPNEPTTFNNEKSSSRDDGTQVKNSSNNGLIFGLSGLSLFIILFVIFIFTWRRQRIMQSKSTKLYLNDTSPTQHAYMKDYDPESAATKPSIEDVASTDIDEEEQYIFHDTDTYRDTTLLPLATSIDESRSIGYNDSLRLLEEIENNEDTLRHCERKEKCHPFWKARSTSRDDLDARGLLPLDSKDGVERKGLS